MGKVISVLWDSNVFIYSMGAETWRAGSCHTQSFIIDGGESAEVLWEADKDREKESNSKIHKFIFILKDNRRQTILQSVDTQAVLIVVTDQQLPCSLVKNRKENVS